MKIADSHCHIHFSSLKKDLNAIMERAHAAGVDKMLLVGIDPHDIKDALETASLYAGVSVSIGIHPQNAGEYFPEDVAALKKLVSEEHPIVAVGETGFDLYHTPETEALQRELFRAHIELARELKLPLIIHDREAHIQTLSAMDDFNGWSLGGVFHCYSGDIAMAKNVIKNGFFISVPGVITYKKADLLRDVVTLCPLDSLLVETDAPFLAPVPYRGKRNEPSYLRHTLQEIANVKGCSLEAVADATRENFLRLFS